MSYFLYQHKNITGNTVDLPAGKVVCIGRNYLDHIRKLGNEVPEQALLFMKPATALLSIDEPLRLPT
jgi:2-keto-4-pentenoate hydratase/2-oxohepta-3-ene-1,7-dioic acid hydratase in catechol pathway